MAGQRAVLRCSAWRSSLGSEGRKREERDEREVRELTLIFLKNFNESSKNFEYESCSKFKILQLSFQAQTHMKLRLKVKFEFLMNVCYCPIRVWIQIFLQFLCSNLKILEHDSFSTFKTLQLWFWAKVYLSYVLEINLKAYLFKI